MKKYIYLGLVLTITAFSFYGLKDKSDSCQKIGSRSIASSQHDSVSKYCEGTTYDTHATTLESALKDKMEVVKSFTQEKNDFSSCKNGGLERVFDYKEAELIPAKTNDTKVYATYLGVDAQTGDTAMIRDHGNNVLQLILTVCLTGDASMDNMLRSGAPTITSTLSVDQNVPNKAECPGRINAGDVLFGNVPSYQNGEIPIGSRFQPPKKCM
jgi:hypothetical protein